ncbi:MAG: hypothetical protein MI861_13270, partial [Pirellulales bacterium]|nr:hypothetical protein [Pirellulales bacterium]
KLIASEKDLQRGATSPLQVSRDKLEVIRAEARLELARAMHQDRLRRLELEVAYAQRRLLEVNQEQQHLQRLVAKGYGSTKGLNLQTSNVDLAKKELERVQKQLEIQQKLGDD